MHVNIVSPDNIDQSDLSFIRINLAKQIWLNLSWYYVLYIIYWKLDQDEIW